RTPVRRGRASLAPVALGALLLGITPTLAPTVAHAQRTPTTPAAPSNLSLEEAVALARVNSPSFQQSTNQRRRNDAQVRSALGSLLPSLSTSVGSQYREGRPQLFAGQTFGAASSQVSGNLDLNATASYSIASFTAPRLQRASREAVDADIGGAGEQLRTQVSQQYLTALQQQARAELQDTLVATAQTQLELAKARVAVGAATVLDVRRAEVAVGQQQVLGIQARNQAGVERLRLLQMIGIEPTSDVRLTSRFTVADPGLSLDNLLAQARTGNPSLNALRARERVADLGVRSAKGTYLPTLNLQADVSAYSNQYTSTNGLVSGALTQQVQQCEQQAQVRAIATGQPFDASSCAGLTLTPAQITTARAAGGNFFSFARNPYTVSAYLSFPIFNGFNRELQVQTAQADRYDAESRVRAQELQLTADVTAAFRTLDAERQVVAQDERSVAIAKEALYLAQERYRVGAGAFLDVSQARDDYNRAQTDFLTAVYEYHRAFATLENAVGRPLR
ncbi:MAG: TolC family protein, partial [Candidatus Eremiobacteraeota bacterium]|nr:TolC family protein [Candidatus Eremiobacteraeota bacterium]